MLETLHEPTHSDVAPAQEHTRHGKKAFGDAVDEFCDAWIETVRKGRRASRDLREDCEYAVKKRPLETVGGGVLLGLALGGLVGWAFSKHS
jgi:ElaB/YqjD/DUF883 family membrane-anchored ribosome-binding protein